MTIIEAYEWLIFFAVLSLTCFALVAVIVWVVGKMSQVKLPK